MGLFKVSVYSLSIRHNLCMAEQNAILLLLHFLPTLPTLPIFRLISNSAIWILLPSYQHYQLSLFFLWQIKCNLTILTFLPTLPTLLYSSSPVTFQLKYYLLTFLTNIIGCPSFLDGRKKTNLTILTFLTNITYPPSSAVLALIHCCSYLSYTYYLLSSFLEEEKNMDSYSNIIVKNFQSYLITLLTHHYNITFFLSCPLSSVIYLWK